MKNKVRIGKDFTIRWALLTSEGEPYAINADAAILRIYSPYGVKEAIGFIVSGNVIEWVFMGKDQKHLGDYTIELVENNGRDGMVSVDSEDAFTLVAHTNEESLNDEGAVEIQTIELTSQIALAPVTTGGGGGGSYDDTKIKQDIADLQEKDKATDAKLTELSAEKEDKKNKVTSLSDESTDVQYPSAKCVHDSLSSLAEELASNGVLIEDLQNTKIDRENDDYYPKMAVGLADNLAGVDVVDSEINFRRSGGGAITDGVARIESIKGNSVVWNQLYGHGATLKVQESWDGLRGRVTINGTFTSSTASYDTKASGAVSSFAPGHKALAIIRKVSGTIVSGKMRTYISSFVTGNNILLEPSSTKTELIHFGTFSDNNFHFYRDYGAESTFDNFVIEYKMYDLTQMFGAGNEPTTIEEFYARIPMGVDLNAYNEGEVIHMDVRSIESQGVNVWDKNNIESGRLTETKPVASTNYVRSKDFIPILPNTLYNVTLKKVITNTFFYPSFYDWQMNGISSAGAVTSFTTPSNAKYLKFFLCDSGGALTPDMEIELSINISDTAINGKYYPYIKRVEDLSIIRKYFPQGMKLAGSAHDEIYYDKMQNKKFAVQRIGSVDLGTLNYSYTDVSESYPLGYFRSTITDKAKGNNMICSKYETVLGWTTRGIRGGDNVGVFYVKDGDYTNAATFKAAMAGVMLYYELAEPIVTELDEADQFKDLDYQVWNAGTEKAIAEGKSAPLAADITYGFNAIGKIKELESLVAALRAKVGI